MIPTAFLVVVFFAGATPFLAGAPLDLSNPSQRPTLKSIYSTPHDLQEFLDGHKKGLVLVFLGTECPVVHQYLPRLNEIYQEYRKQGVPFLGIYSDRGLNAFRMAQHAQDEDIAFPVLQDVDHKLADLLGVKTTAEVVVLDPKLVTKYQGAIDDQFKRLGGRGAAKEHYLVNALEALLKGEPSPRQYVPASACPIERRKPQRSPREVTYYKDVAPIVQKNCQGCHRKDGPGPFELLTYNDVSLNSEKIREVVIDRRMPPWHAVLNPEFGKLVNDMRLSDDAVETIVDWIDADTPEGNRPDAPTPVAKRDPHAWLIGKPDFVYKMPEPFRVPKFGTLEYQFFRVKLDFDQDRWFRAVEIRPGNSTVVHHITLHVAPTTKTTRLDGLSAMMQLYGLQGGASLINDFLPGDTYNAKTYPPDQAVLIPKHSDLIFEVHYTPNNREATTDQSMVAFQWAHAPPPQQVHTRVFRKPIGRFRLPPYESHFRVEDTFYFEQDIEIDAIRPHFHLRGQSYRLEMIERDPKTDEIVKRTTILSLPLFDQAWQRTYELATPLKLPAGTELLATGYYDNSALNPRNPDPSAEVNWGQQTTDEMFSTRFKYRIVDEHSK